MAGGLIHRYTFFFGFGHRGVDCFVDRDGFLSWVVLAILLPGHLSRDILGNILYNSNRNLSTNLKIDHHILIIYDGQAGMAGRAKLTAI